MAKRALIISFIAISIFGLGAGAIAQVQPQDNQTTQTPEIATAPKSDIITTEPDPEASWEIPKELIDKNQAAMPQDNYNAPPVKQTLKDAGYDGAYQADNYTYYSPEDQKIIDSTPHRKREIEPAKKMKLMELSRIMGALHALRVSCVGNGDQTYRSKMATLLDLEAPSAEYIRDPLIIAFNSGFESYGQGENPCPKDRDSKEANLAKDGRNLSLKMAQSYRDAIQNKTNPKF